MKYKANWIKTKDGNGIKTGHTLIVKVTEARIITGIVSRKTFYGKKRLQIGQSKNTLSLKLKEKKGKLTVNYKKGNYVLLVWAYDKKGKQNKWTDEFEVI